MPRTIDRKEVESKIAQEEKLHPDEVRKIVQSQFRLVKQTISEGEFAQIRLSYFGRFWVHPQRLLTLQTISHLRCRAAKRYKGVNPPKCNEGNPCESCTKVWEASPHNPANKDASPLPGTESEA